MMLKKLITGCFQQEDAISQARKASIKWQDWILPIPGVSKVGNDPTYEDDFQYMRDEISKITDTNTQNILIYAEELLKNHCKDVRVITYYIWARLHQDGESGFADGLLLLATLVHEYGEELLPTRTITRKLAFEWLCGVKIQNSLSLYPEVEKNNFKNIIAALAWLQSQFESWSEENRPNLNGLITILENRLESSGGINTIIPQNSTASSISSPQEKNNSEQKFSVITIKSGRELLEQSRLLSSYLHEQPQGWLSSARLMRCIRWDTVHQLPSHDGGKKTRLTPPRSELKNALKRLYIQQKWIELLEQAENMFMEGVNHFWLDIQWYVYQALNKSDNEYTEWAKIIKNDLQMLLDRLPGLHDLTYDDGTPFADEVTHPWIEQNVLLTETNFFADKTNSSFHDQNSILDMESEALTMIDKEGEEATLTWLMQLPGIDSTKSRWLQRLLMARITEQCGKIDMAVHLLKELEKDAEPFQLQLWEPELMFEVKARLLKLLRMKAQRNESDKIRLLEKMEQLLSDLVSIDPSRAFILFN
ncbi:type VI secretion system protein TssA [Commensalibacter nepenthis]|uniref:Type VI secretion system protein TssA n=1 Tax=Commensalibacter nepenthis TaxID=3043872 RepID=A0ABT6Q4E7_9PROT|nr:type VI secretion system protein TssA [Commensalibacter sp. TBRC 10068]MDI2111747.1 type VI secretion system protein TssA [Commensalibacter sp. TBRC 10068]